MSKSGLKSPSQQLAHDSGPAHRLAHLPYLSLPFSLSPFFKPQPQPKGLHSQMVLIAQPPPASSSPHGRRLESVQVLIQMLGTVRTRGHGLFIVLPDRPTRDLPGLCFKESRGLLSRVAESNQSESRIFDGTRLFNSREDERGEECSCSLKDMDSLTVSEDLVENLDRFVGAVDGISNGSFLRGEESSELGSDWVELEWLKAKGYYSIEAFVANRLEVALRLAWLNNNSNNKEKRGVKLKEKANALGVAANAYWRKNGCMD